MVRLSAAPESVQAHGKIAVSTGLLLSFAARET
jgi:hypothetical protein